MTDFPDLVTQKEPMARKSHKCCECSNTIKRGEKYEFVNGLWSGDFLIFRTCMKCVSIRNKYAVDSDLYPNEYPPFTELYETMRESDYQWKEETK